MRSRLGKQSAAGYASITLWVLEANARARRFYARAGFTPDGARHLLDDLGGVAEIRYRRTLTRPGEQEHHLPPERLEPRTGKGIRP